MTLASVYILRTDMAGLVLGIFAIITSASVAIGTVYLAIRTSAMAKETRKDVEVARSLAEEARVANQLAREQVQASERTLSATIRPWLVAGEDREGKNPDDGYLESFSPVSISRVNEATPIFVSLRVRNVGPGMALFDSRHSYLFGRGQINHLNELCRFGNLFTDSPVIPPGDEALIWGAVSVSSALWSEISRETFCFPRTTDGSPVPPGEFALELAYTDAEGGSPTICRISVLVHAGFECRAHRIDYFEAGLEDPSVTVRVGGPDLVGRAIPDFPARTSDDEA